MDETKNVIPVERIEQKIIMLRDHKVILDAELATLYQVKTKALIQAVKRNLIRFPPDFMFQLNAEELTRLRSHSVTIKLKRGAHRKYRPYAFTEQGVAMLSSVLRSPRAVQVNIEIMRTFVRLRQLLATNVELKRKLDALEKKYDGQFRIVFDAIRKLMIPSPRPRNAVGFAK
jgi:hypothetical protein